ncbi:MAG: transcription elongation factor GreA [Firmicutes bacterium]|uniref:Transcription elongation factor GreA n=1 Tax=Candidatus Onthovivens merdipullorum TaxID=2840889 RepID=A0A9D9GXC7_9BACL|nr:transcription elongation factor GreA [Candidatus Onthovivens merdipullorum]
MANEKYKLTAEGKEDLEREYREILDVKMPEVVRQLAEARAMGDLSENADYDAARDAQAKLNQREKEIEEILNNCIIVDSGKKNKTINVSSTVTYKDLTDNENYTVRIVSSVESDPVSNPNELKVSNECALGSALIGHKEGEVVTVKAVKPYDIQILTVK